MSHLQYIQLVLELLFTVFKQIRWVSWEDHLPSFSLLCIGVDVGSACLWIGFGCVWPVAQSLLDPFSEETKDRENGSNDFGLKRVKDGRTKTYFILWLFILATLKQRPNQTASTRSHKEVVNIGRLTAKRIRRG